MPRFKIQCSKCKGFKSQDMKVELKTCTNSVIILNCKCSCGYKWDEYVDLVIRRPPEVFINVEDNEPGNDILRICVYRHYDDTNSYRKINIQFPESMLEEGPEGFFGKTIALGPNTWSYIEDIN